MSVAGTKQADWQLQFQRPELPHGFQRRAFFFSSSRIYVCIAMACRILVLPAGIEPTPSAVTAQVLTTGLSEVPGERSSEQREGEGPRERSGKLALEVLREAVR